jgi:hypothetical protein
MMTEAQKQEMLLKAKRGEAIRKAAVEFDASHGGGSKLVTRKQSSEPNLPGLNFTLSEFMAEFRKQFGTPKGAATFTANVQESVDDVIGELIGNVAFPQPEEVPATSTLLGTPENATKDYSANKRIYDAEAEERKTREEHAAKLQARMKLVNHILIENDLVTPVRPILTAPYDPKERLEEAGIDGIKWNADNATAKGARYRPNVARKSSKR